MIITNDFDNFIMWNSFLASILSVLLSLAWVTYRWDKRNELVTAIYSLSFTLRTTKWNPYYIHAHKSLLKLISEAINLRKYTLLTIDQSSESADALTFQCRILSDDDKHKTWKKPADFDQETLRQYMTKVLDNLSNHFHIGGQTLFKMERFQIKTIITGNGNGEIVWDHKSGVIIILSAFKNCLCYKNTKDQERKSTLRRNSRHRNNRNNTNNSMWKVDKNEKRTSSTGTRHKKNLSSLASYSLNSTISPGSRDNSYRNKADSNGSNYEFNVTHRKVGLSQNLNSMTIHEDRDDIQPNNIESSVEGKPNNNNNGNIKGSTVKTRGRGQYKGKPLPNKMSKGMKELPKLPQKKLSAPPMKPLPVNNK